MRVAEAVDRAWPAIENRGASLADAAPYRRVRLGPTYVRESARSAGSGRTVRERSWEALDALLPSLPARVDEHWTELAREARALLAFDFGRIVVGGWQNNELAPVTQTLAPNAAVQRARDTLTVPLDPGPFTTDKEHLAEYIETAWSSRDLLVRVRWTSQDSEPGAYRFVLGTVAGEPSSVSEGRRLVRLNPDVRSLAIAHEVGHVLGFVDRYSERYDASRCAYIDERDAGDIMSNPEALVTEEEWSLLARAYSASPTATRP
jgi:hypothetical protein